LGGGVLHPVGQGNGFLCGGGQPGSGLAESVQMPDGPGQEKIADNRPADQHDGSAHKNDIVPYPEKKPVKGIV